MLLHNRILDTQTKWYKGWWTNGYRDLLVNLIQNQIRSWVGVTMNFFKCSSSPGPWSWTCFAEIGNPYTEKDHRWFISQRSSVFWRNSLFGKVEIFREIQWEVLVVIWATAGMRSVYLPRPSLQADLFKKAFWCLKWHTGKKPAPYSSIPFPISRVVMVFWW